MQHEDLPTLAPEHEGALFAPDGHASNASDGVTVHCLGSVNFGPERVLATHDLQRMGHSAPTLLWQRHIFQCTQHNRRVATTPSSASNMPMGRDWTHPRDELELLTDQVQLRLLKNLRMQELHEQLN